ncbi:fumarylacetoacetate hydrolase family protein [Streptomyces canus]|uniref:fumarylacetoacetate hydrolase family protein n=1 Tax=Streptomyces canus TaxID=58343 RepID=UPI0007C67A91|nr:fumarylacetoacetate hydrolase family protein [Streptomyces canus]
MRLVMFESGGDYAAGVQLPSGDVVPVRGILGDSAPGTVAELIAGGPDLLGKLAKAVALAEPSASLARDKVRLGAPVGRRELVVCAGTNYRSHLEEMGDELPAKPAWFIKNSRCVVGPDAPIVLPPEFPSMVDYEGELCVVIGRPCHAVRAEDAWDYVAGYTLLNDVSARDGIPGIVSARTPLDGRWAWTDMLLGKQFPTFGPIGPAVVTADEIDDPGALRLTTTVNGVTVQDAPVSDLAVGIPELIEQFSRYFPFQPGDVISTGTPGGVGVGRKPPVYLRRGDVVTVAVDGIGQLTNPVRV